MKWKENERGLESEFHYIRIFTICRQNSLFHKKIVNDVGLMDAYVDFVLATILLWTTKT